MLEEDEYIPGTIFAVRVLAGEESSVDLSLPSQGARSYSAALDEWVQETTPHSNRRGDATAYIQSFKERLGASPVS